MRAYVTTSGLLYVALVLAHVARLAVEGTGPLRSIAFVATSAGAIAMAAWSWRLYRRLRASPSTSGGD